jgi:Domain of unknown function (DUF4160)
MPEISKWDGVAITMYFDEGPEALGPAHFHAWLGPVDLQVFVESGRIVGRADRWPRRQLRRLDRWRRAHAAELLENWARMRRGEAPLPIAPTQKGKP